MVKAIVGGNWGDEGKGKMTDLLAGESDIVVRYQGGANAGHTIINDHGKFALHLLPSGVFQPGVVNILSQGVAFNLEVFFQELDALLAQGVPQPNIMISDRAQLILPHHVLFDRLEEERLKGDAFGSTKSGIAPFYSDKYLKVGVQVSALFEEGYLRDRLRRIYDAKNLQLKAVYGCDEVIDPDAVADQLLQYRDRLAPMVGDVAKFLNTALGENKSILLEGQLGSLKDPDNGIYPFTTSSSPLAGYASVATGIPPYKIEQVYTVVKAYSSAVGAGAFVSEIFGDEAQQLRERGGDDGEYGATTGRPRRMGWFDVVASRYGCMVQGTTDVVLSLLDVLGYLDKIPVCAAYEIDGEIVHDFPATPKLVRARPVMEYLYGWSSDIRGVRKWMDLPREAQDYVLYIEDKLGYPITAVSTGPKREDIIFRR